MLVGELKYEVAAIGYGRDDEFMATVDEPHRLVLVRPPGGHLVSRRRDYDGLIYAENRQLLWCDEQFDAASDAGLLVDQSEQVEGLDHLVD